MADTVPICTDPLCCVCEPLYSDESKQADYALVARKQPRSLNAWVTERLRKQAVPKKNRSGLLSEHTEALQEESVRATFVAVAKANQEATNGEQPPAA